MNFIFAACPSSKDGNVGDSTGIRNSPYFLAAVNYPEIEGIIFMGFLKPKSGQQVRE